MPLVFSMVDLEARQGRGHSRDLESVALSELCLTSLLGFAKRAEWRFSRFTLGCSVSNFEWGLTG